LLKISDTYENLSDKQLYFLDENLNPVKVTEIEKIPYEGKIYDVTVKNHIILVKRDGIPVWSGNSYSLVNSTVTNESGTFTVTLGVQDDGGYNITATSYDNASNSNTTSVIVTVDTINPSINFTSPTPENGTTQDENCAYINVSVNDSSNTSSFIDWNRSLVGYWNFNENSGNTAYDFTSYGNNGTLKPWSAEKWVSGQVDNALQFDSVDDYVDVGNDASLKLTGAITVEAWIRWGGGGNPYFVTKFGDSTHRSYDLSGNSDGTAEFRVGGTSCSAMISTGEISIPTGEWVHLVGVYEPSSYIRLFVNGSLAKENTVSIPASQCENGLNWYIGAREGNQGWFNGTIDEVRIYNRSLNATEINWSYQRGLSGLPSNVSDTGLVGYWALNETGGDLAEDSSNESNDGTLHNYDGPIWSSGKFGRALDFDGVEDYITITDSGLSSGFPGKNGENHSEMTLSAWFNADTLSNYPMIAAKYDSGPDVGSFECFWYNNELYFGISTPSGGSYATKNFSDTGNWHYVAGIYDGSKASIYVDGVKGTDGTIRNDCINGSTYSFRIGSNDEAGSNNKWDGTIDEVRIWNRALSPEEINASYNSKVNKLYRNFTNLSDGEYEYYAYSTDLAGNSNKTGINTLTIDANPPTVTLTSPQNDYFSNNENITFNCSATDYSPLTNITLYWNYTGNWESNGTNNVSGTSNSTQFVRNNLNDKTIAWNCYACDNWSQCGFASENYTVTVDTTKPSITIHKPENGSYMNDNTPLLNVTEVETNPDSMWYSRDSGSNETNGCNATSCLVNLTKNWVVGSGGDSWSGNVTHDDTTEVQATGNVELRQLVDDYVSYWRLDDNTTVDENTINSNDGINYDATYVTSGKYKGAFDFDGYYDHITLENLITINTSITNSTICIWIKSDTSTHTGSLLGDWDDWDDYIMFQPQYNRNVIEFSTTGTRYFLSYSGISETEWNFFTFTFEDYDATHGKVYSYINGLYKSQATYDNDYLRFHMIAAGYDNPGGVFFGKIDEVRYYDRVLSPTEINQTMNNEHSIQGNLTSIIKDAEAVEGTNSVWKQVKFDGTVPTGTNVSIYVNMSTDNSTWCGWVLVKENATNGIFYEIPTSNQTRYGSWRLVLQTNNASVTPEISSVTFGASLVDGGHNVTVYANDTAGNLNSSIVYFTIDTIVPFINFKSPTPGNNSYIPTNHTQINLTITEPNLDTFKFNWNSTDYKFYDDSLVLAMNFNNNSAIGECYDEKTQILTSEGWKHFRELNKDETVLTLNPKTKETEWQLPLDYQVYDHNREMYEIILEDGSKLLVSPEHRVYAGVDKRGDTSNPSFFKTINFPSKSSDTVFSLSNMENAFSKDSGSFCGILSHTIENISSLVNSTKSSSLVINILCSDLESSANMPFESPFDLNITSNPCCLRNCNNSFFTFSSSRNFSSVFFDTNDDIITTSGNDACIMQSCFNMGFCEWCWKSCDDLLDRHSCFKHLQDLPDHNSSAFESWLSMTDFAVNHNIFINFDSHNLNIGNEGLNNFYLLKISELYRNLEGKELYFLDSDKNPVHVLEIRKVPYSGKIYDVDVLNDIVLVRRGNSSAIWSGNSNQKMVDISKYGNDGNCSGNSCPNWTSSGRFGGAFEFDGEDDYILAPDSSSLSFSAGSNFTFSVWVKTSICQTSGSKFLEKKLVWPDIELQCYSSDNKSQFRVRDSNGIQPSATGTTLINDNQWHHLVGVKDGNNIYLYVDGSLEASDSASFTGHWNDGDVRVGTSIDGGSRNVDGTIDEVRIYNRALNSSEIWMHYQSEFQKYNSTEWRFYNNVTNLTDGTYTYYGWANDTAGNSNSSETRTLTVDITPPAINFTSLTPGNNSFRNLDWAYINVSVNDSSQTSSFIDWNHSLVGYWNFNENSGNTAYDFTSYGNNGTLKPWSAEKWVSGQVGNALQFDGVDDYIDCGNDTSLDITAEITIEAWVKPMASMSDNGLITKPVYTSPYRRYGFKVAVNYFEGGIDSTGGYIKCSADSTYTIGEWYHLVQTYNGTIAKLYINGVKQSDEESVSGTIKTTTEHLYLGSWKESSYTFNGIIDEVRIYNRTLNATEINWSYQKGLSGLPSNVSDTGLVGYWALNETDGNLAEDSSNESNDGTLRGYDRPIWSSGKFGSAVEFDGVADYVNCGNDTSLNITGEISIEAWVKPNSLKATAQAIVSKEDSYVFAQKGDEIVLYIYGGTTQYSSGLDLVIGSWQHVVVTYNESVIKFYKNGNLSLVNYDLAIPSSNDVVKIGTDSWNELLNGTIDEVRIWNRVLSPEEINASYNSKVNRLYRNFTNLSDGEYEYYAYSTDLAGNTNKTETRTLMIDTAPPAINFTSPTPGNNSYIPTNHTQVNLTITEPNLDTFKFNWNATNYTFYDDSLVLAMNVNNNSAIGECYDKKTEILTSEGWKLFSELNKKEKVLTLNLETKEKEWQLPLDYQTYDHNREMYEIVLEDGTELLVSPEHRVYGKVEEDLPVVSSVMMLEGEKNDSFSGFVYSKFENETFENMDSSLTFKFILQRFIVSRVQDDLPYFILKNFFQNRILLAGPINLLPAFGMKNKGISHSSNISSTDPNLMKGPFILCSNSFLNSSLSGSSSTGCQSIFSQNSQSSSVISPVCLYLSDMSRFINLITTLAKNSELTLSSSFVINSGIPITTNNNIDSEYLNHFSLLKISELYENLTEDGVFVFLDEDLNPVKVQKIEKIPYSGKIYDVDVPNDIVLVRRGNSSAIWSGNSNTKMVDISQYGNNGSCSGANCPNWTSSGRFGGAFEFDGEDDYINCGSGSSLDDLTTFTWSAWIYPTGWGGDNEGVIIQKHDGKKEFRLLNGGGEQSIRGYLGDGSSNAANNTISLNTWQHVVVTYSTSDGYLNIYVNGNEVSYASRNPDTTPVSDAAGNLEIGRRPTKRWFNGTIDEVRIYNRALSAEEIWMHHQSEFQKYNSTEWRFYNNITNLSDGTYTYYGWANDSAGNSNKSETRTLTIDTTPPNITIVNPQNQTNLSAGTTWTWINISTDENAVCRYNLTNSTFNFATQGVNFTNTGGQNHSFNYSGLQDGQTYTLYYKCNDSTGNINPSSVMHVFSVKSTWHTFYGHVTGNISLEGAGNETLYRWNVVNVSGNVYVADADSTITWTKLYALGKMSNGSNGTTDFKDADTALGINAADNISIVYTDDNGNTARNTTTFNVFKKVVYYVPIDESTNNTNFWSGILWDSSDSTDNEFNATEEEDLIFVVEINENAQGKYDMCDYEIKIPYKLQEYKDSTDMLYLYLELR